MTQAQQWEAKFKKAFNRDRAIEELNALHTPVATLFNKDKQTGRAIDANIVTSEFYVFTDGSLFDGRRMRAVEVVSPLTRPLKKVDVIKQIKNDDDKTALESAHFWPQAA